MMEAALMEPLTEAPVKMEAPGRSGALLAASAALSPGRESERLLE